ncbi:uncharacterized protein CTHT_0015510 [Thermochaetoides thermophila DSM 1495]|uniref:Uncharacterized protein n=1 Tax=Chaetomium thermophilum (strain DSM 1495 / CBS 144.50 / IMI 039719) TaxID=759272 RepID=G0S205_CHATD|nr:hypothetical protein CTHT_0015510 [Thermochaetoides thermophila DSM 1495]EGS23065.1 hypothetical protein CTHT_0015510 [Thermochaetoides thermophila DSM 1495]
MDRIEDHSSDSTTLFRLSGEGTRQGDQEALLRYLRSRDGPVTERLFELASRNYNDTNNAQVVQRPQQPQGQGGPNSQEQVV